MSATPAAPSKGRIVGARTLTVLAAMIALVGSIAFYVERTRPERGRIRGDRDGVDPVGRDQQPGRGDGGRGAVRERRRRAGDRRIASLRPRRRSRRCSPASSSRARQEAATRLLERPRLQDALGAHRDRDAAADRQAPRERGRVRRDEGGDVVLDLRPMMIAIGEQFGDRAPSPSGCRRDAGRITIVDAGSARRGADDHPDPPLPRRTGSGSSRSPCRRCRLGGAWAAPAHRAAGDRHRAHRGRRARAARPAPRAALTWSTS